MGGSTKVPGPSAEERELQKNQAELLALQRQMIEQQNAQNAILLPFLAEQEGFDVTTNETGNITSISKRPDALADKRRQLEEGLTQRSLDALAGNLPVDPALEQNLTQQENELRERLATQFGPGYETSTPAIETLGDFFRNSEVLREGARTGQLTLAEQLGLAREQQNDFSRGASQDVLRQTSIGDPLTFAGAFGQVARGFGQAQQPYIQQRQMQAQASAQNNASRMSLFGAGLGAIGAFFSDEDVKGDKVLISYTKHGLPIYEYTRKDTGERMLGIMAQDAEEMFPGAIYERNGYMVVQYKDLN